MKEVAESWKEEITTCLFGKFALNCPRSLNVFG